MGRSGALRTGDWVLTIGLPSGGPPALSAGIFSARRRGSGGWLAVDDWLETSAAVHALNSGGPLINLDGEVVGISSAAAVRRGEAAGMGYALTSIKARRVAADLAALGRVRRAYLGVQLEPVGRIISDRGTQGSATIIATVAPEPPPRRPD